MSNNKYLPHIHVLTEDDANRQIANGFIQVPNVHNRAVLLNSCHLLMVGTSLGSNSRINMSLEWENSQKE